jgi:hypothetical protein
LFWTFLIFLKIIIFIEKFDKISKKGLKNLYKRLFTQLLTIFDRFGANRVQSQSAFFQNGGSISQFHNKIYNSYDFIQTNVVPNGDNFDN